MEIRKISSIEQKTAEWSGGSTTELYIYPESGNYQTRDFKYRISTAVCRDAHSVFTYLPGIKRKLLVLDGDVTLTHNGQRCIRLCEGAIDAFMGDDLTESDGTCIDFNLMINGEFNGTIDYVTLQTKMPETLNLHKGFTGIYLYHGELEFIHEDDKKFVKEKDFIVIHADRAEELRLVAYKDCKVVIVKTEDR